MTPEILINWIIEGRIYDEVKGSGDYAEDGRYVWPERMEMIVKWAKDAKEPVIQADADKCSKCHSSITRMFQQAQCYKCGKVF